MGYVHQIKPLPPLSSEPRDVVRSASEFLRSNKEGCIRALNDIRQAFSHEEEFMDGYRSFLTIPNREYPWETANPMHRLGRAVQILADAVNNGIAGNEAAIAMLERNGNRMRRWQGREMSVLELVDHCFEDMRNKCVEQIPGQRRNELETHARQRGHDPVHFPAAQEIIDDVNRLTESNRINPEIARHIRMTITGLDATLLEVLQGWPHFQTRLQETHPPVTAGDRAR